MLRREEAKYADRLARLPIRRKPVSKRNPQDLALRG
jgi:hypothetical protein